MRKSLAPDMGRVIGEELVVIQAAWYPDRWGKSDDMGRAIGWIRSWMSGWAVCVNCVGYSQTYLKWQSMSLMYILISLPCFWWMVFLTLEAWNVLEQQVIVICFSTCFSHMFILLFNSFFTPYPMSGQMHFEESNLCFWWLTILLSMKFRFLPRPTGS